MFAIRHLSLLYIYLLIVAQAVPAPLNLVSHVCRLANLDVNVHQDGQRQQRLALRVGRVAVRSDHIVHRAVLLVTMRTTSTRLMYSLSLFMFSQ